jgi:Alpha-(1,3)-fucosyltransferase FucT N-terminal domain/Glycosyltransferase family 10 (fucosyltransferase) C-term
MTLRVAFTNFWPGAFDGGNSDPFLSNLVRESCGEIERTDDVATADIVISSVFGQLPSDPAKTIQIIGENQRPNFSRCRYALSFDYDTYFGRNHRLPLWWSRLDWPEFAKYNTPAAGLEPLIPIDSLLQRRPPIDPKAKQFCVLIAGNPESLRINLFLSLQTISPVMGYGKLFNNPLGQTKFDVLPQFRYCLCPENGIYPGYHTEKPVDAWFGGCVPLYSGDRMLVRDFNPRALVNYQDQLSMAEFIDTVSRLEADAHAFNAVYTEPLLLQRPSLYASIQFLREAVAAIRRDARA